MTTKIQKFAFGAATALMVPFFASAAAMAGDYNGPADSGGGLKDMRGAYVPVPAPMPIPEHSARWYLRIDAGIGFHQGMTASESGMSYGAPDTIQGFDFWRTGGGIGMNGGWGGGDEVGHIFGAGIGYYHSSNLRMDFTVDHRMDKTREQTGSFAYTPEVGVGDAILNDEVRGSFRDRTLLRSWLFMANGYYDMNRGGRWNPYLGAGLGFSLNETQRSHRSSLAVCNWVAGVCEDTGIASSYSAKSRKDYTYSLAASAMAGVTYRISERTSLDFNYRYLYVGGTDNTMSINGHDSKVTVDDQHEHYLRAGLRWDIK